MKTIQEVNALAENYALGGVKVPHRVSHPVLRVIDGQPRICYFVHLTSKDAIETGNYPRPSEWFVLDIEEGDLLERFDCHKDDFSQEPFDHLYPTNGNSAKELTLPYYEVMCQLFDNARASLIYLGAFDKASYGGYIKKLMAITPTGYQVFYRELSTY